MGQGWRDETDEYGFRRCYRDGELRCEIPPRGHITRGEKAARIDWPTLPELVVCVWILVPAIVGGLIAGAGWIVARMFRRG